MRVEINEILNRKKQNKPITSKAAVFENIPNIDNFYLL